MYMYARTLTLTLTLLLLAGSALQAATLTVTTGADTGAGSLRTLIGSAASGDTIIFDGAVTSVTLTSGDITVGAKDLSIDGGGTVTIDGSGNADSGLIFNSSTRTWLLDGLTFSGFRSPITGGAVRVTTVNDYSMTIQNCTFDDNQSTLVHGGAIGFDGGARWSATLSNCTFTNNQASSASNRNGGAIYMNSFSNANVASCAIRDCTFTGNLAGNVAGAILMNDVTVDMDDCSFNNNVAGSDGNGGDGGALYFQTNRAVRSTIDNCQFTSNSGQQAGAIRFANRILATFTACTFTSNNTSGGDGGGGGGACHYGVNSAAVLVTDVVFDDCTFSDNRSNENDSADSGGAIKQGGGAWTFSNCTFSGNQSTNSNNLEGGAFSIDDNNGTGGLCLITGCRLTNNIADKGGAIFVWNGTAAYGPTVTIVNSEIDNNIAAYASTDNGSGGGGIMSNHSTTTEPGKIIMDGCNIHDNTAQSGGGCMIRGPFDISNTTFTSNSATRNDTNAGGGAIRFQGEDDTFIDTTRLIEDCTFTTNTAITGPQGGAANDGGAIFSNLFSWTMRRCSFISNQSHDLGGGIYLTSNAYSSPTANPSMLLEGCTFDGNIADQGAGMMAQRTVSITGCTFDSNACYETGTSFSSGGGLYVANNGSRVTISNSTFFNNTCEDRGGGIDFNSNGTLKVYNTTVVNNAISANAAGGGMRAPGGATTELYSCLIANNDDGNNGADEDLDGTWDIVSNCLIRDGNGHTRGTVTNSLIGVNPQLPNPAALTDNGGATETIVLPTNSPCIDVGSNVLGLVGDQRGSVFPRELDRAGVAPAAAVADIGAFELPEDNIFDFIVSASPNITLRLSSSGNSYEIVSDASGTVIASQVVSLTNSLDIDGAGTADTLTVDFSNGNPIIDSFTDWSGAVGADTLQFTNGSFTLVYYSQVGPGAGYVEFDGDRITYSGLAPVVDTTAAVNRQFRDDAGSGDIRMTQGPGAGHTTIDDNVGGARFEQVTFANPTGSLLVHAQGSADRIIANATAANGLFGIAVTINGGNNNDEIIFDAENGWAVDDSPGTSSGTISGHLFSIAYLNIEAPFVTLNNVDATLVPTLTQWGIFILFLLIGSFGMIQIARMNGVASASVPLDLSSLRLWAGRCAIALLAFWTGCILLLGHLPLSDLIGGAICLPVLAYFLHLIQLLTPQLVSQR
ncbi:MAG: hypothetical protein ACI8W8_003245 [Rhodothermales bacterium]|jgi:hypothetical protein